MLNKLLVLMLISFSMLYADCNHIKESDLRQLCIAETRGNTNNCNYIKDVDKKHYCLAILKQDRNHCHYIKDNDLKYYCLSKIEK